MVVLENKLPRGAGGGAGLSENKANSARPAGALTGVGLSLAINSIRPFIILNLFKGPNPHIHINSYCLFW